MPDVALSRREVDHLAYRRAGFQCGKALVDLVKPDPARDQMVKLQSPLLKGGTGAALAPIGLRTQGEIKRRAAPFARRAGRSAAGPPAIALVAVTRRLDRPAATTPTAWHRRHAAHLVADLGVLSRIVG
jgi:hypothetical protein